jgi:hypothetical protein
MKMKMKMKMKMVKLQTDYLGISTGSVARPSGRQHFKVWGPTVRFGIEYTWSPRPRNEHERWRGIRASRGEEGSMSAYSSGGSEGEGGW